MSIVIEQEHGLVCRDKCEKKDEQSKNVEQTMVEESESDGNVARANYHKLINYHNDKFQY